jgi:hypothetical protein
MLGRNIVFSVIRHKAIQTDTDVSLFRTSVGLLFSTYAIIMFQVPGLDENNVENGNVSTLKSKEDIQQEESDVKYGIDDVPSWYLCILMGLQVIRVYRV